MATDLEKLVVTLEASVKQYERALASAQKTTVTAMRGIEKTTAGTMKKQEAIMAAAGKRMGGALQSAFAGLTRGLGAGLVAGLGIDAISEAVGKAVKDIAALADAAEQMGTSAQNLQTWNRMAVESGESADVMARALAKVAEQSRDSDSELMKLFEQFRRAPTGDVTEDMKQFMDILAQMKDPADRLAAIMNVLGEKLGPRLAEALTQGGAKFEATFNAMEQNGEHFTDAQLQQMQEIETQWNLMTDKMETAWHQAILTMMSEGTSLLNWMRSQRDAFQSWWLPGGPGTSERFKGLSRSSGGYYNYDPLSSVRAPRTMGKVMPVDAALERFGATRVQQMDPAFATRLSRALIAAQEATGGAPRITSTYRTYAEQAELYRRYRAGTGGLAAPPGQSRHESGMAADIAAGPVLEWLHKHAPEFGLEFLKGRSFVNDPGHIQMQRSGVEYAPDKTQKQTAAIERNTTAVRANAEAKKEADKWDVQRQQIYDQSESDINMLSRAYETQQQQLEQSAQGMAEVGDMLGGAVSGFVNDLMNGVDAGEAFTNMLKNLASQLMDMAIKQLFSGLFGGGMGGGLLGGIIGGGAPAMAGASTAGMVRMGSGALKSGMSGSAISIGGATINVAGNADTRTVAMMSKMIEVNNQVQSAKLNREWGQRSARFKTLRSP